MGDAVRIYVASNWRNVHQPGVVEQLRAAGHEVYDYKDPTSAFNWREVADPAALKNPKKFRDQVLRHPIAKAGFSHDMAALRAADATVLVLPCGRSAHLELGWATGAGQKTFVLLDDPVSEPELMYLMCSALCVDMGDLLAEIGPAGAPSTQFARACRAREMIMRHFPQLADAKDEIGRVLDLARNNPPEGAADGSIDEVAWSQFRDVRKYLESLLLCLLFDPKEAKP